MFPKLCPRRTARRERDTGRCAPVHSCDHDDKSYERGSYRRVTSAEVHHRSRHPSVVPVPRGDAVSCLRRLAKVRIKVAITRPSGRSVRSLGQAVGVNIRLLGRGDERLAEEACRVYGTTGPVHPAAFLSNADVALLIAEHDGEVVGCVYGHELVHPDGERTMLLYSLDVVASSRGLGVGTRLVTGFVEHARGRGCTEVWVLTDDGNPAALATYRSAGGRRDPVDAVMFTWRLAQGRHS